MRIVFVCTTNVWGSAMAELIARSLLSEWDPDRQLLQVYSAGVRAQIGAQIPAAAQQVLAERGLDGSEHRARWMSRETLATADLTLTMGEVQRDAVLALNPRGLRTTFTLREAEGLLSSTPVAEPFAPEADLHTRAVVNELAATRRFRKVPTGSDNLPDLMTDAVGPLRALVGRLEMGVCAVLQALLLPDFADPPIAPPAATQVAAASAVA